MDRKEKTENTNMGMKTFTDDILDKPGYPGYNYLKYATVKSHVVLKNGF